MQINKTSSSAVLGTVTANAGTDLNTSDLARESGGNLDDLVTVAGTLTDPGVNTDSPGTLSSKIRGIVSRLAELVATAGITTGSAVTTNADGTIQQYLRGLITEFAAKIPVLGQALMAASTPVVIASDQSEVKVQAGTNLNTSALALDASVTTMSGKFPATLGTKAAAASLSATLSTEDAAKVPSLGSAAAAASIPATIATDDPHLGSVGTAKDVDGVVHAQLRYIGEAVDDLAVYGQATMVASTPVVIASDQSSVPVTASAGTNLNTSLLALETTQSGMSGKLPATLGTKSAATSLSVALSTEDAAKVPALGQAAASASVPTVEATAYQDCSAAPVIITIADANSTQSAVLPTGLYIITSNLDVAFLVGSNPTALTTSHKLGAWRSRFIHISTADDKVAAIRLSAVTGWVSLDKVK